MANNYHFYLEQNTIEFQNRDLYILLIKKKTSVVIERFFNQKVSTTTSSWWRCYSMYNMLLGVCQAFSQLLRRPPTVHEPLWNSAEFCGIYHSFCTFLLFYILEFSFEGIWNSVYTSLYEIPRNFAVLYSKKCCGITRNYVT